MTEFLKKDTFLQNNFDQMLILTIPPYCTGSQ